MAESEQAFIERRRSEWQSLETLVTEAHKNGLHTLTDQNVATIGPLYRKGSSDLAWLQRRYAKSEAIPYLNGIISKAHTLLFADNQWSWHKVLSFFIREFPLAVQSHREAISLAAIVFLLGSVVGALAWAKGYTQVLVLLPQSYQDMLHRVDPTGGRGWTPSMGPVMSSMIMVNNIRVTFLAFALGITFGLGTLWILWLNGLMIGPLAMQYYRADLGLVFWAHILPHGVIELPAIFLAAGAGLELGRALLLPGDLPRIESLKVAARRGLPLLGGTVFLLIIAGLIEGFYTPKLIDPIFKLLMSAGTALLLVLYLASGNNHRKTPGAPNS